MAASFRSRLIAGEKLLGTIVSLPASAVAEILAEIGFDWLFLDAEHGPFEIPDLLGVMQAVSHRTPCVVRLPSDEPIWIKRTLDIGAAGVIVPQVNTAEQAAKIVEQAKYSPDGGRGLGLARAHGYGLRFEEYVKQANTETAVIVQTEHIESVNNIEEIVQVPGVDAVLIGPYDLSASMGKPGQVSDPEVVAAIDRVTAVCQNANKPLGIFGVTSSAVKPYMQKGFTLLVVGVDTVMIASSAKRIKDDMQS